VGVVCRKKRGDAISAGEALADVHARDESSAAGAIAAVQSAYAIGDQPPHAHGILLDLVE
jgi:thymidine phosphorylase